MKSEVQVLSFNKKVTVGEMLRAILPLILPLIGVSVLTSLAVLGGLILLIVPGIVFGLMFSLAPQVLVIEGEGIIESMKRSAQLTKVFKGQIFGLLLIVGLVSGLAIVIISLLVGIIVPVGFAKDLVDFCLSAAIYPISACILIDVNAKDMDGMTALLWAAREGYAEIVRAPLNAGADVTIESISGRTALGEVVILLYIKVQSFSCQGVVI